MIGAIIGDIIGSRFEFNNTNKLDFDLFGPKCDFTDDTICTVAIADAIFWNVEYKRALIKWCRKYPNLYGSAFSQWINSPDPQPYGSMANGSAMRVSPIGWAFDTLKKTQEEAEKSAIISHNHPDGIKGAVATASAIFCAKEGKDAAINSLKEFYNAEFPLLGTNPFHVSCERTLPICLGIIEKTNSFEEAIRYAVAVGGDSDTIAAIVGSIAERIYGIPESIYKPALKYLPLEMQTVLYRFCNKYNPTYKNYILKINPKANIESSMEDPYPQWEDTRICHNCLNRIAEGSGCDDYDDVSDVNKAIDKGYCEFYIKNTLNKKA